MAQSETDVANVALGLLGADSISELVEESNAARRLKNAFESQRDATLRAHPWSCALARASLAKLGTAPAFGFTAQFTLPADFLRLVSLNEVDCWQPTDRYRIESGRLLTNDDTAKIRYVRRITDLTQFDALLYDAFARRLAWSVAYAITGSAALEEQKRRDYMAALAEARGVNAQEQGPPAEEPPGSWDLARL